MDIHLSPYKLIWAEFFPAYGIVTKHDRRQFGEFCDVPYREPVKTYRRLFADKATALDYIRTFHKKLDKSYIVRLSTDKQVGMAKEADGYAIPYTKKQYAETYNIG